MKKILSAFLILSILLASAIASAAGLDDLKTNVEIDIPGFGVVYATDFAYKDRFGFYRANRDSVASSIDFNLSGTEAEYAVLRMDITNTDTKARNYLSSCTVKVIFDNTYEYTGKGYQYNYNNKTDKGNVYGDDSGKQNVNWVVTDMFDIEPMYQGHFGFICALPNAVVNSTKPLRMIITLEDNEIVYYIRK